MFIQMLMDIWVVDFFGYLLLWTFIQKSEHLILALLGISLGKERLDYLVYPHLLGAVFFFFFSFQKVEGICRWYVLVAPYHVQT